MALITSTWQNYQLYCLNHEKPERMVIQEGPNSAFYACPKYKRENVADGEKLCNNRLNFVDYTNAIEKIHSILMKADENDESPVLTNLQWKDRKGTIYKVLSDKNGLLKIGVLNKQAMKK